MKDNVFDNIIIEELGLMTRNSLLKIQGNGEALLEALIICLDEKERKVDNYKTESFVKGVIQKATGKSWEEIRLIL